MDGDYTGAEHTYAYQALKQYSEQGPAITARYSLPAETVQWLMEQPSPFTTAYAEYNFYDKYSRLKQDGTKESWAEVCIRVVEGIQAAEIDHCNKHNIPFHLDEIDKNASAAVISMFKRHWCPPGRGLFIGGTAYMFSRGCAAMNNCYAVTPKENLPKAMSWTPDMLMCGGGVGMDSEWDGTAVRPNKEDPLFFSVPDTREGWDCAIELLIRAYVPIDGVITNKFPKFDLSLLREYGTDIKGYGGTASGPEPLRKLLNRIEIFFDTYIHYTDFTDTSCILTMMDRLYETQSYEDFMTKERLDELKEKVSKILAAKTYGKTRLIADVFNAIGCCVAAGNVRRSAEIFISRPDDKEFYDLKNLDINPERGFIRFASNNTVRFTKNEEFNLYLDKVTAGMKRNGEPGFFNLINTQKYARYGDEDYGPDDATLLNPCGETCLESYEPCTLSTVCPPHCIDKDGKLDWYELSQACRHATWYATVVTTIRHHWPETQAIMEKNRRIGVSQSGVTNSYEMFGPSTLIQMSRMMYHCIRDYNTELCKKLHINRSKRVTVIKPEGTLSIIMELNCGTHFALHRFDNRIISVPKESPIVPELKESGYHLEQSVYNANCWAAYFPITTNCERVAKDVNIFEQMTLVTMLQRSFADNSVSFTGTFDRETGAEDAARALALNAPFIKACSMLPEDKDTYPQMPFTEITEEEYLEAIAKIKPIDFRTCFGRDAVIEKGCNGDVCLRMSAVGV